MSKSPGVGLADTATLDNALKGLNLKANPFEDFELFEGRLDPTTLSQHELLFKDREELLRKTLTAIFTGTSYKLVLHGDLGVGKSSILNRIIYEASKAGYFAFKYRVSLTSAEDVRLFEREFLRALGEEVVREALRNEGLRDFFQSILRSGVKRELKHLALLSLLYSSGQVTVKEGHVETAGLSATIGIPILKAELSGDEQKYIEVARTETLSHLVFERLLRGSITLLKELGYKGILIGIDEVDKLEQERLERNILTLVKDTFYPTALAHIIIVMRSRDSQRAIHPDIFHYELVPPLPKNFVIQFLEELYNKRAIDDSKPLTSLIDSDVLELVYRTKQGRIRFILKDLFDCVVAAVMAGSRKVDRTIYQRVSIIDPAIDYAKTLQPNDAEYMILQYLLENTSTYSRDKKLPKHTGLGKSALNQKLSELKTRGILTSAKSGNRLVYELAPGLKPYLSSLV